MQALTGLASSASRDQIDVSQFYFSVDIKQGCLTDIDAINTILKAAQRNAVDVGLVQCQCQRVVVQVAGDVEAVSRNQRHVSQLSLHLPISVFHSVPHNVGLIVKLVPANLCLPQCSTQCGSDRETGTCQSLSSTVFHTMWVSS